MQPARSSHYCTFGVHSPLTLVKWHPSIVIVQQTPLWPIKMVKQLQTQSLDKVAYSGQGAERDKKLQEALESELVECEAIATFRYYSTHTSSDRHH